MSSRKVLIIKDPQDRRSKEEIAESFWLMCGEYGVIAKSPTKLLDGFVRILLVVPNGPGGRIEAIYMKERKHSSFWDPNGIFSRNRDVYTWTTFFPYNIYPATQHVQVPASDIERLPFLQWPQYVASMCDPTTQIVRKVVDFVLN